jgi:sugar phosphate permease
MTVNETFNTNSLGLWWTLWIISNLIGQFVFRYSMNAESIDELTTTTIASMIANIVGIPLALITIKIVKDYSNVEPLLIEIKDEEETTTTHNTQ